MRSRSSWLRCQAIIAAGLLAAAASPQAEQPDDRPVYDEVVVRESVVVREIHLDAVITDRENSPVLDLKASDFNLRVDGEKVRVTGVTRGTELRETLAGRLTIVVFLDERHLAQKQRDAALDQVQEALLREMAASPTWVALTMLGEELRPLLAPTRDREAVITAFAEARASVPIGSDLRQQQRIVTNEVRDTLRQMSSSGSTYRSAQAGLSGVTQKAIAFGEQVAADTRSSLAGIGSLVEALSFVPGRKAILLLSDGLPLDPLDQLAKTMYDRLAGGSRHYQGDDITAQSTAGLNDSNNRPTGSDRMDATGQAAVSQDGDGGASNFQRAVARLTLAPDYDQLAALANTHRVTFYPLKPPVSDADVAALGEASGGRNDLGALSDTRAGLERLASATGGLAFTSGGEMTDFLSQAQEDISTYYSISFTPPASMPGSGIREMELKVRRKKSRVRHRASYLPLSLEQSLASRSWGTLVFDWQENSLGLTLDTQMRALSDSLHEVEVAISLPIGALELVPNGPAVAGSYKAVLQLRDRSGSRLEPLHLGFVVEIPSTAIDQARSQYFAVRTTLRLITGQYDLVVGLWEENSGTMSFVVRPLVVEAIDENEA